jgi:hypothetical protein
MDVLAANPIATALPPTTYSIQVHRMGQRPGMFPERQPFHPVTDGLFQLYDLLVEVTRKPAPT